MSCAGPEVKAGGEAGKPPSGQQGTPLLRTKLFIPPLRPRRVSRPRLFERLNTGLDKALILVSAPAGYGKTTLVSGWLHENGIPSAWISLDEGDNDLFRFLHYFITALQKIVPAIPLEWLGLLQGTQPAPHEAVLHLVINEIAGGAARFVLVLDDFHTIQAQPVLDMLAFLIEHTPPQMHFLILTRTDPPLPLFRLRARNQLVEIRAEQLRFTNEETAFFLNEVMELRLSADHILALEKRTEGWIAGLQLASVAALGLPGTNDVDQFVTAFTGSHYYIMDYLTEEVLKLQPERVSSFLLQTSILTSMCASLCDAVLVDWETGKLGIGNQSTSLPIYQHTNLPTYQSPSQTTASQEILEYLDRANLFVVPLDDKRQWYRYHHLFADMLSLRLEKLSPKLLPELHRRAQQWYEQHDMIHEATRHALLAGDPAVAARLVEQNGCSLLMRGEGFTLLKWVEAVESYTQTHPWLAVLKAWALVLTGCQDRVEPTLQTIEELVSSLEPVLEVKILLGSMAAVRAYLANLHGEASLAADYAQGALEYLPDSNAFSCSIRSVATSILGDASLLNGNLESARHAYLEAVRISQAAGNAYMTMIANANLADVLAEQGELHQAARTYSDTLQTATRPDGQKLPMAGRLYAGLGKIYYQWNHLEEAGGCIHQCIELCQQWGNSNLLAESMVRLARLERAWHNSEKAQEAVRAAEQLASESRLTPRQSARVRLAAASEWIAQGNLERPFHLLHQLDVAVDALTCEALTSEAEIPRQQEPEYLLLLRLLLTRGDYEAALLLSGRLLRSAQAAQRMGRVIEVLVLQALALQGNKDLPSALSVLERALSLAQPEGYARVFLDEGEPMAKLLYQAVSRQIGEGYAAELLSAFGRTGGSEPPPAQTLIEPLTLREIEVLKLIEAGCSNQDIAGRLVISIPTVKRHISNIYAKLGAKNRTQAVSLGRELRLFE